ncbi:LOW QUALITY PROTEIN: G patch domain-containing protein 1 homolog [Drosophila ficusphila]|uniref:LOW QUALITY PROTEIN: G patch domain-containing protein 1 homolog n=1 Tax=Drosophila ficusphila TaxID=30025 RepID=UPI0007E6963F|nr:LOW QUALITY PROTEIN: G patch domain-containing protein 1 homolog [Drosophila ficusphila]
MDEEEHLHRFGTPLPKLEKDVVPAKKPVAIEDQIVKDENGKRRFHGAFTGGFSAGFWNTVGSLEGWTPQTFKSSRAEKATPRVQARPEDFMDNEDLGEFGIAPQGIRTRDEFAKEDEQEQRSGQRRRKLMQPDVAVGPIPGVPVLEQLLRPVRDKVAVRILKSMGWKPGQGVGPRQTKKEKRQATARNTREQYLLEHYGAEGLPSQSESKGESSNDEDEDDEDITFAPDDYEPMFFTPKENRFGMSYSGLSRDPILSKSSSSSAKPMQHINLFGQLEAQANKKTLSIRGQAFGVGAFEEEDEDIYARDDMTRYDFSLADKKPKQKKQQHVQQRHVIDGFSEDKTGAALQKPYAIDLPRDFEPRNWLQRKSRFAPIDKERAKKLETVTEYKRSGLGRHDLNPDQRAQLLGEQKKEEPPKEEPPKRNPFKDSGKSLLERINARTEGFTKGGIITEKGEEQQTELTKEVKETNAAIQEKAALKTKDLVPATSSSGAFKPFLADEAKQLRYEKFVASKLTDDTEITEFLANMQPVSLSLWDREMEKKEFIQAAKIYRPLDGLMNDRFVSEANVQAEKVKEQEKSAEERKIVMERTKTMWKPASLLCKRYNIAEPFGGAMLEPEKELKTKPKISVFDYLETSINTKANFQTPTIIPKHIEKPKPKEVEPPSLFSKIALAAVEPEKPPSKEEPAKFTFVPKTSLEQAVDESRDKPIAEKIDLFKSIFEDSDEEEAIEEPPEVSAEDKLAAVHEALGLPSKSTTSAATQNVLRNTSPPRGIFAALFKPKEGEAPKEPNPPKFAPIEGNKLKIAYKSREERLKNDKELAMAEVPPEDIYGPKLPSAVPQKPAATEDHADANIDAKLQQLWQKHAPKKRKAEVWVEKKINSDSEDSDDSSSDDSTSSDSSAGKVKKSKLSKPKKSHKSSSSKKSKKSKLKSKKKSKKSDKSKHKTKKKKSKH